MLEFNLCTFSVPWEPLIDKRQPEPYCLYKSIMRTAVYRAARSLDLWCGLVSTSHSWPLTNECYLYRTDFISFTIFSTVMMGFGWVAVISSMQISAEQIWILPKLLKDDWCLNENSFLIYIKSGTSSTSTISVWVDDTFSQNVSEQR